MSEQDSMAFTNLSEIGKKIVLDQYSYREPISLIPRTPMIEGLKPVAEPTMSQTISFARSQTHS